MNADYMIGVYDNFLFEDDYNDLNNLHIEYSSVHWYGAECEPKNPLHKLVELTYEFCHPLCEGATAWYNIRPIDPQWHNDIDSYCTQNGVKYMPKKLPEYTCLYYMRTPDSGGELELETGDLIQPGINRLVVFPCKMSHRVRPYTGNRVSIGIIWWHDISKIYGDLSEKDIKVLPRVWEIEDKRSEVWS